ncbi:hypothetical protein QFC21_007249 [Naganishia friedmannii]|uniref:Uncharacterized protein n=1 Tax=Naganishia friedmannii TaxID=89922 RepID=A0ACC2UWN5_9TREE|nr:hypothetical protein QFC21_007249 [Naganishia friedmannii]
MSDSKKPIEQSTTAKGDGDKLDFTNLMEKFNKIQSPEHKAVEQQRALYEDTTRGRGYHEGGLKGAKLEE